MHVCMPECTWHGGWKKKECSSKAGWTKTKEGVKRAMTLRNWWKKKTIGKGPGDRNES